MPAGSHSAFKQLYSEMFKNGGDFNKLSNSIPKVTKQQIKCYVKESFPHFLVTDNYFYVACYFTKKAVDDFKSRYSNMNITDLKSKVILITEWTLEMNKVNSAEVFTSYGGLEVRLIVKQFKVSLEKSDQVRLTRHPVNMFRDDEMKTLIQNYTHECLTSAVKSGVKSESIPDISKFSAKSIVGQGVVSFASGNNFNNYSFKEGKTATVDMSTIFKQEKGADALKKLQAGPAAYGKAKVVGGSSGRRGGKAASKGKSGDIQKMVQKISKYTPSGNKSVAKKSTARILTGKTPALPSPGDKNMAGTTDHTSMKEFRKMISYLQRNKKSGLGKRGGGKLSTSSKAPKKK
jgi:hypothetical protein